MSQANGQVAAAAAPAGPEPKKLILCFDGTGNTFSGSNADTNVVKLLAKLDRNHPDQFHYYQTGIGTYDIKDETINKSYWGEFKSNVSMTLDQGFGTTFDAHVLAGYRFLMRYYEPGCKIYVFGFSRGAFTAKFLARMVNTVGLLCKGNEEMVPFAYKLYQRYLEGDIQDRTEAAEEQHHRQRQREGGHFFHGQSEHRREQQGPGDVEHGPEVVEQGPRVVEHGPAENVENGHEVVEHGPADVQQSAAAPGTSDEAAPLLLQSATNGAAAPAGSDSSRPGLTGEFKHSKRTVRAFDEITAFSQTFCRNETVMSAKGKASHKNIKVYFLGIWDCVNSVAVLEKKAPIPVPVTGTARWVRHAVAVDERRVKFKPALLAQDVEPKKKKGNLEDVKEVWFPGCHGDVGGGWPCAINNPMDVKGKMTVWQRIKGFWRSRKPEGPSKNIEAEPLQMSDSALYWMIHELEIVAKQEPAYGVKWAPSKDKFKELYRAKKDYALKGIYHDSLAFSYGTGFFRVVLWWFMEYLPLITRWELVKDNWVNTRWPLNRGSARDIPRGAVLHESLLYRLQNVPGYRPSNNHGDLLPPCLHINGLFEMDRFIRNPKQKTEIDNFRLEPDPDNNEWVFAAAYLKK